MSDRPETTDDRVALSYATASMGDGALFSTAPNGDLDVRCPSPHGSEGKGIVIAFAALAVACLGLACRAFLSPDSASTTAAGWLAPAIPSACISAVCWFMRAHTMQKSDAIVVTSSGLRFEERGEVRGRVASMPFASIDAIRFADGLIPVLEFSGPQRFLVIRWHGSAELANELVERIRAEIALRRPASPPPASDAAEEAGRPP